MLLVVVWNVHRFQVGVEGPVLVDQEVLGPAVDSHRRDPAVVDLLDDGERIFRAAGRLLAEDPDDLRGEFFRLLRVGAEKGQGAGVGVDASEHLVMLEPELDRAVAPHREPADRPAEALGSDREGPLDQFDDVLDQIVFVGVSLGGVGIPPPATVRHDDHQGEALDIAFDTRPSHPDGVVVGEPVEEVED